MNTVYSAEPFRGLGVALATPFSDDQHTPDLPAFRALVRHVVAGGADYLVVLGSTGEAATVETEEREALLRAALEESQGLPVVAGVGHNSTAQTVRLARQAAATGAHGLLVVTPYYNKPQPEGVLAHFRAVAGAAALPIIAYNVPGRTGQNMSCRLLEQLWELPQVVAVKESSGDLAQIGEMCRCLPAGKLLIAGDDALALPSVALGACGVISVAGNAIPAQMADMLGLALAGQLAQAQAQHRRLLPLIDALFSETNPVPLKAALHLLGLCGPTVRLPLLPACPATTERLRGAMSDLNLLGSVPQPSRQGQVSVGAHA